MNQNSGVDTMPLYLCNHKEGMGTPFKPHSQKKYLMGIGQKATHFLDQKFTKTPKIRGKLDTLVKMDYTPFSLEKNWPLCNHLEPILSSMRLKMILKKIWHSGPRFHVSLAPRKKAMVAENGGEQITMQTFLKLHTVIEDYKAIGRMHCGKCCIPRRGSAPIR